MKDDLELLRLKSWGHQLFDLECQRRHVGKNDLYAILAKKLKRKQRKAHFGHMNLEETNEAISFLLSSLKKRSTANKKPTQGSKSQAKKAEYKALKEINKSVPMSEIRKAIQNLPKIKTPWYKRIWRLI